MSLMVEDRHEIEVEVVASQKQGPVVDRNGGPTIFHDVRMTYSSSFEIAEVDGEWSVTDNETGIFGVGGDEDTALRDYLLALVEHRDVLAVQPSLSEDLQSQLRYLRRVVG